MWDMVGIVASVVVIIFLFQLLDLSEAVKNRLKGGSTKPSSEARLTEIEKRLSDLENKLDK